MRSAGGVRGDEEWLGAGDDTAEKGSGNGAPGQMTVATLPRTAEEVTGLSGCASATSIILRVMHRDEIRQALRRIPFHPFKLHLADGTVLDVPHPEFLALRPNGRSAFLYGRKKHHHIDLMLVTAIEVLPDPEADPFDESDGQAPGERAA